jgi:hypothetical protein
MSITKILLSSDRDPLNDKIAYFKSPTLASKVIDSLGLQYHVQSQGRIKNKDFYGIINWKIISELSDENTPDLNFSIVPSKTDFTYIYGKTKGVAYWGQPIKISQSTIVVENPGKYYRKSPIQCFNENKNTLAFKISQNILVSSSKTNNVLTVKYSDESVQKAVDVLNKLIKVHNEDIKRNKSLSFLQAIDFIEKRMEPLKDELDSIENNVASFKANNEIFNTVDGSKYVEQADKYDEQLYQMQTQEQNPKIGYYTVCDKRFYSKPQALLEATATGHFPHFNFNREVYSRIDTTVEPQTSLRELYRMRAKQLRDRYDYIRLEFSGGSDSTTVLYSFINNGLHIDEVVFRYPAQGDKNLGPDAKNMKAENTLSEWHFAAKPILQKLAISHPTIKITMNDFSQNILDYKGDESWVENAREYLHPEHTFKHDPLGLDGHKQLAESGKTVQKFSVTCLANYNPAGGKV